MRIDMYAIRLGSGPRKSFLSNNTTLQLDPITWLEWAFVPPLWNKLNNSLSGFDLLVCMSPLIMSLTNISKRATTPMDTMSNETEKEHNRTPPSLPVQPMCMYMYTDRERQGQLSHCMNLICVQPFLLLPLASGRLFCYEEEKKSFAFFLPTTVFPSSHSVKVWEGL